MGGVRGEEIDMLPAALSMHESPTQLCKYTRRWRGAGYPCLKNARFQSAKNEILYFLIGGYLREQLDKH
jgi:hypothetical protein